MLLSRFIFCVYCSFPVKVILCQPQKLFGQIKCRVKPPLAYQGLKKIGSKRSNQMGEDVYWMKYQTKLVAGSGLQVFTKRGFAGMDTFYVADSDSSYLKKIAHDIQATKDYNKQFGEFTTSYKEINAIKKGQTIKEVVGGI